MARKCHQSPCKDRGPVARVLYCSGLIRGKLKVFQMFVVELHMCCLSCCLYFWQKNGTFLNHFPKFSFIRTPSTGG